MREMALHSETGSYKHLHRQIAKRQVANRQIANKQMANRQIVINDGQ